MTLKVAYINPTKLIRRPLAELANHFEDSVVLVPRQVFHKHENPWHNKLKCKILTYPVISLPFIQFDWPIPISLSFYKQLWNLFKKYDVIHMWTFFYISSWTAMLFKQFNKKTKLIMSCDTLPAVSFKSGAVDYIFKTYYSLFGWTFKIPDKVHTYTLTMKSFIEDKFKINVEVISTGIALDKFDKIKKTVFSKQIRVIYAGLICKRKGIDRLIKLTNEFDSEDFHFVCFGDGPDFKKYFPAPRLFMYDWTKNLPQELKNSDICILLSKGEGLPGILMEAMACKLPIIATDIPGNKDLVEHEKSGFLCNTDEAIINALLALKNKNLRMNMGIQGYNKIKSFEWNKLFPLYQQMYGGKK